MKLMSHPSDEDVIAGSRDAERVKCLVRARLSVPQPWSFIERSRPISSNERASVGSRCSRHARASARMKPRLLLPLHRALAPSVPATVSSDNARCCRGKNVERWYTHTVNRSIPPQGRIRGHPPLQAMDGPWIMT